MTMSKLPTLYLPHGGGPCFFVEVGRALAPLREQGVFIAGSGLSSHNLKEMIRPGGSLPEPVSFEEALENHE